MSQSLFFVLLLLACPLMMIFMMRGHGHGGSHDHRDSAGHGHGGHNGHMNESVPVDELRRRRDELDREIADRESYGASSDDRRTERP